MSLGSGPLYHSNLDKINDGTVASTSGVETVIGVRLPYRIPDLDGSIEVLTETGKWTVLLRSHPIPVHALEPHLEGVSFTVDAEGFVTHVQIGTVTDRITERKRLSVVPDRWGRAWRTDAELVTRQAIPFPSPEPEHVDDVLGLACRVINRILEAVIHVGGPPSLVPVVPDDFWGFRIEWRTDVKELASYREYKRHPFWWGRRQELEPEQVAAIQQLLRSSQTLTVAESLLASAAQKLARRDTRGAVLDSVSAVETASGPLVDQALKSRGVNKHGRQGLGRLRLSARVNGLLPALFPGAFDEDLLSRFAAANTTRNDIVHEGASVLVSEASRHLAACRELVELLDPLRMRDPTEP